MIFLKAHDGCLLYRRKGTEPEHTSGDGFTRTYSILRLDTIHMVYSLCIDSISTFRTIFKAQHHMKRPQRTLHEGKVPTVVPRQKRDGRTK